MRIGFCMMGVSVDLFNYYILLPVNVGKYFGSYITVSLIVKFSG